MKYTNYDEVVDMVLMTQGKPFVLACKFNLSVKWVRTLQRFTAGAYLAFQTRTLGKLVQHAGERQPLLVVSRFGYDETGEKLTINLGKHTEQRSVWQVLVARMMILVGWWDAAAGRCTTWNFDIVLPTLLVASPNADNLYRAMFFHPSFAPVWAALRLIQSKAQYAAEIHETDGAYACTRLWAHLLDKNKDSAVLDSTFICRLHSMQLNEVMALQGP